MNNFKNILCPIDFSQVSENTVKYALSFSEKFHTEPQILHVSTKPPEVYYRFFPDASSYLQTMEQNTQIQMNKFIQKFKTKLKATVRYGTIYHEIIQYAQDNQIDLIIVPASEFSSMENYTLSTVNQKVIRKAECPVLIVYEEKTQFKIKKILCPIDLSSRSYQGLLQAAVLARKFNAKIYLLHVIELHEFQKKEFQKFSTDENFAKLSKVLIDEIKIPPELHDIQIEKIIRRNIDAAAEIAYFASANNIDFITLTTHGRGYWPRVLLGSVAEKVLKIAPCPVLTVRIKK